MNALIGQDITFGADMISWIVFVEVPTIIMIVLYMMRMEKASKNNIEEEKKYLDSRYQQLSDKLSLYKLEVSQKYASVRYLKDVEIRLTNHLIRVEKKLDKKYL